MKLKLRPLIEFCVKQKKFWRDFSSIWHEIWSLHEVLFHRIRHFLTRKLLAYETKSSFGKIITVLSVILRFYETSYLNRGDFKEFSASFIRLVAVVVLELLNFFGNLLNILYSMIIFNPPIHYLRTWQIGDNIIFSPNKILLAKTRRTCCCTLFIVRHLFSCGGWFFFDEKILSVRRQDRYPDANPAYSVRQKTCLRNIVNAFYTLFTVRCFAPISLLFVNSV